MGSLFLKNSKNKLILSVFLGIGIFTLIQHTIGLPERYSSTDPVFYFDDSPDSNSSENFNGSFFVSNTSESYRLFYLDVIPQIGQKWDITLKLDKNSTTNITWEILSGSQDPAMWEGLSEIDMNPGATITLLYISHVCGDNYDNIMLYFSFKLTNSSASVSGSYYATLLFLGYPQPPECNAGQLIIEDISEWLNSRTSDRFIPSLEIIPGIFSIFTIVIILNKKC